jgi:FkbM family methyltransferase
MSRMLVENPFINHACKTLEIEKAPINTNIYETYAQCNEDLIVDAVLRAQLTRAGRDMRSLRYIEIGANHPVQTSSTYLLSRLYGATGVLVEANPALAAVLERTRKQDKIVNCAVSASHTPTVTFHIHEKNELSSVSKENISRFVNYGGTEKITDSIECRNIHINDFMRQHYGGYVDYFMIDIEGLDFDVLNAMDPIFQPTIIQCEHSGDFQRFVALLAKRGYGLLAITDVNLLFLRQHIL